MDPPKIYAKKNEANDKKEWHKHSLITKVYGSNKKRLRRESRLFFKVIYT